METNWKRRKISLPALSLSVLERASESLATEPPILLLHGLVAEGDTFRSLMAALPRNRRVIALDFPGAGYSDTDIRRNFDFEQMAEVVHNVIESLGLDRPVLLGHSHGGVVALELAQSRPESLNSLVLLCPAHPFSGREDALVNFYLSRMGHAFGHLLPRLPDWLHLLVFRHMPGGRRNLSRAHLMPYLHTLRKPGTVNHLLSLLRSWKADMNRLKERMVAEPLAVPTLLIWGERDVVVPVTSAKALTDHLKSWEMYTLPGVGHLPNEEAPEECAALIKTWLIWRDTHWKYADLRQEAVRP